MPFSSVANCVLWMLCWLSCLGERQSPTVGWFLPASLLLSPPPQDSLSSLSPLLFPSFLLFFRPPSFPPPLFCALNLFRTNLPACLPLSRRNICRLPRLWNRWFARRDRCCCCSDCRGPWGRCSSLSPFPNSGRSRAPSSVRSRQLLLFYFVLPIVLAASA